MDARAVLDELQARGAVATVRDGVLCITPRTAIDDNLRAEIRARKSELLQVLAVPEIPDETEPASTCRLKRVSLANATLAQIAAITPESLAVASKLRARLVADGVTFKVSRRAGRMTFPAKRLCVEWQSMSGADWASVIELRAEIQKLQNAEHSASNAAEKLSVHKVT